MKRAQNPRLVISWVPPWVRYWILRIVTSFWFRPALLVLAGMVFANLLISIGSWYGFGDDVVSYWLYNGGASGARTLLGTIAGSVITVAGTTFSITIATLTLASNQMGPRLLRNFTEDRGNQYTLGVFLGTFAYALVVLGSVRAGDEGTFVPHLAVTGATVLSLMCVGMLVYFVHHIASRINVDVLMEVVMNDFEHSIAQLSTEEPQPPRPDFSLWDRASDITLNRRGYIQDIDEAALATWADEHDTALLLFVRPGDYVFPNAPVGQIVPPVPGAEKALEEAVSFGIYPTLSMDLEFAVSQLVDLAVRALSPSVNDPRTAMRVLDHLGAGLCRIAGRHLVSGVERRRGRVVYARAVTDYAGLTDAMFHMIRQSADSNPAVGIHLIEVLARVAQVERLPERLDAIVRHADLMAQDAERISINAADKASLRTRVERLHENVRQSRAAAI